MIAIILNLILAAIKFFAGWISGFSSIYADATNNLMDVITSLFTLLGVQISKVPGGGKHKNGHGRIEWIVALIVSMSVMLVGWELLKSSISAIQHPESSEFHLITLLILVISVGIKVVLYFYNRSQSEKNHSEAFKAAAVDCISDAISTAVVSIAFVVEVVFSVNIDGWSGLLVSAFIIRNGFASFLEVSRRVIGEAPEEDSIANLEKFVLSFDRGYFTRIYDTQIYDYGCDKYGVSFCVKSKSENDQKKAAELRTEIYKQFGYIACIQVETHETEENQRKYLGQIEEKMHELSYQTDLGKQTRVVVTNHGVQILLYVNVHFDMMYQEEKVYSDMNRILEEVEEDVILSIQMGRGNQSYKRKDKSKKEISFENSVYDFFYEDMREQFGIETGNMIIEAAEKKLEALAKKYQVEKPAMKTHFYQKMLPVIAMYQTFLAFGYSKEQAYAYTQKESEKNGLNMKKENEQLGKMKNAYRIFRMFAKNHMKTNFPYPWFEIAWIKRDSDEVHFDIQRCPYHETCVKEECDNICALFCEHDNVAFEGYLPCIRFERSQTIGTGGNRCDFHFINTKRRNE